MKGSKRLQIVVFVGSLSVLAVSIAAVSQATQLKKSGPVTCDGEETLHIKDKHVEAKRGHAIEAAGNCEIFVEDSEIVAEEIGILARDNASIRIEDSRITGDDGGIFAQDEASVSYKNSIITGGVDSEGKGKVRDQGGSLVRP